MTVVSNMYHSILTPNSKQLSGYSRTRLNPLELISMGWSTPHEGQGTPDGQLRLHTLQGGREISYSVSRWLVAVDRGPGYTTAVPCLQLYLKGRRTIRAYTADEWKGVCWITRCFCKMFDRTTEVELHGEKFVLINHSLHAFLRQINQSTAPMKKEKLEKLILDNASIPLSYSTILGDPHSVLLNSNYRILATE